MIRRTVVALVALVAYPLIVDAQESRVYIGGTFNFVTQTHSDREPIGGTTQGGSALFGVQVSPRVAIEFEPSLAGRYSWRYTYRPSPSLTADVVASRHDTFFPIQARIRLGILEPVVGVAFVHGRISRHATVGTGTYFDDSRSDDNWPSSEAWMPLLISQRVSIWSLRFGCSSRRQERRPTRPAIRSARRQAPVHSYSGTVSAREWRSRCSSQR